jgi:ubiquinone/menaquinone biosynthesis C-methylase UbiE
MNYDDTSAEERAKANDLRRRAYARSARRYDKQIGFCERRVLGTDHRPWACSRAIGRTLEVAVGTGLNLPHYPDGVEIVGLDLSPEMLALAVDRANDLGRSVDFKEGDAQELPFPDGTFDTVVCTFSLCGIPDVERTIAEMKRVLRQGGRLILVDHIASSVKPIYWLQRFIEFFSKRTEGEYQTRRPMIQVKEAGFVVQDHERLRAGVMERLVALNPIS